MVKRFWSLLTNLLQVLAMEKPIHSKLNSSSIHSDREDLLLDMVKMYADTVMYEFVYHVPYNVCQAQEPKSLEEALQSEHAKQWKAAADSDYNSLIKNGTWMHVEPPVNHEMIGCKRVFSYDNDDNWFKGHLLAKGYA